MDVEVLCDLAQQFGSGAIDVTTRANLQLRGVSQANHDALLHQLIGAGLVDADADIDTRRNIVATPFWHPGDLTDRLGGALVARLAEFPVLPAKMGFALDTGPEPALRDVSADFRFERSGAGVLVYADGASRGVVVGADDAVEVAVGLARWFVETGGLANRRMARHVAGVPAPGLWADPVPGHTARAVVPGSHSDGAILGVPFGQVMAGDLAEAMRVSGASHLRILPWRLVQFEGAQSAEHASFTSDPDDPVLTITACPGAPFCPQATVATRPLARGLAERGKTGVHVSGCAKGCARQAAAALTIVGCAGAYDVVRDGTAADQPLEAGLTEAQVIERWFA